MKAIWTAVLVMVGLCTAVFIGGADAAVLGDVNRDGKVDLAEAIYALQVISGQRPDADNTYSPAQRTGQTDCYTSGNEPVACDAPENDLPGQDGQVGQGVIWPNPRFTDNGDGTVTDNLTGLTWLKDAAFSVTTLSIWTPESNAGLPEARQGQITWHEALTYIGKLNSGDFNGVGDGNGGYEDWRLPNIRELGTLIHYGATNPAVPDTAGNGDWSEGMPFLGVKSYPYWSSTTGYRQGLNDDAWIVDFSDGDVKFSTKDNVWMLSYVWPVR